LPLLFWSWGSLFSASFVLPSWFGIFSLVYSAVVVRYFQPRLPRSRGSPPCPGKTIAGRKRAHKKHAG